MTSRTTAVRTMSEIFIFFFLSRFIALTLDSVDSTVESDVQFGKFLQKTENLKIMWMFSVFATGFCD